MTELRSEPLTIPGAPLGAENPLPFFRDPAISLEIKTRPPFPEAKLAYLGWETAFRVLPYRMQDEYTRQRQALTFRSVVLENEFLKATFLPEVGGRLISLVYKPQQRELLHRNPVFQPANLAIRNAWLSGGIEWNIGQVGHTFTTCSPLFAAAIQAADGSPGLRLYEFERCKRLLWQIDFYLPPGFPFLIAYTRVVNPNDAPTSMYWWTNTAVNERPGVRVLSPAAQAIYGVFDVNGAAFGVTEMPHLPSLNGADGTYSLNSTFANEFFFQCDDTPMPWEAALDEKGGGFIEASTSRLKYRKLFCWGTHPGGRHWQEFLAQPGEAYLEIQGGLAPTQVHGLPMPANTTWDWTQIFGYVEAEAERVHGQDWTAAWRTVEQSLHAQVSVAALYDLEASCRQRADHASSVILQSASGWGALEARRRAAAAEAGLPPAFVFPETSLGAEQKKWLALLNEGALPAQEAADLPGEWMVQDEWVQRLEQAPRNWYSLLHLGVMRMERFDEDGAEQAWQESIAQQPSAWAYRNLAILSLRRKDAAQANAYYEKAWQLAAQAGNPPTGLAIEYLEKLAETGQWARGMAVYAGLPPAVQASDRVQILRGRFALALDDLAAVEEVLQREYAIVREGEVTLTDLWFELQTRREAARRGVARQEISRQEMQALYPPPARIDFRSIND